ncbi:MAG: hypothetical protein QXJ11_05200 [Candidatus Bathyarchaeia archaeon]
MQCAEHHWEVGDYVPGCKKRLYRRALTFTEELCDLHIMKKKLIGFLRIKKMENWMDILLKLVLIHQLLEAPNIFY